MLVAVTALTFTALLNITTPGGSCLSPVDVGVAALAAAVLGNATAIITTGFMNPI